MRKADGQRTIQAWGGLLSDALSVAISEVTHSKTLCSVMLTGGRSAEELYRAVAEAGVFRRFSGVKVFFGDERCVPPEHPDSNYGLAMRTLFRDGVPPSCEVIRMGAEDPDADAAAAAYEALLPGRIDVLLLSVGEDGHIASLFPGSSFLFETRRRVVHVVAPKPPLHRLTVTPVVITQAHKVFVMALGERKAAVYQRAKLSPEDIAELPARLVLNATWFLDTPFKI